MINSLSFLDGNLVISPGPDTTLAERGAWGYMLQHFARGRSDELLAAIVEVVELVEAAHLHPAGRNALDGEAGGAEGRKDR